MKKNRFIRFVDVLLVICLLLSCFAMTAFADESVATPDEAAAAPAGTEKETEQTEYTVSFFAQDGETVLFTASAAAGMPVPKAPTLNGDMKICGWLDESGKAVSPAELTVNSDMSFTAAAEIRLNTAEHIKYINGYSDGAFRPGNGTTRAHIAQMLSSLIIVKGEGINTTTFTDVPESYWAYAAISKLASLGILSGYSDGSFKPDALISRAEFAAIISRFFDVPAGTVVFSDVPANAWYMDELAFAVEKGWIFGYSSDVFAPKDNLTRAQAVSIINRVLGRKCDASLLSEYYVNRTPYYDVQPEYWAFGNIIEASVAHDYKTENGAEIWTDCSITVDRAEGITGAGSVFRHVDEKGLFTVFDKGMHSYEGGTYYSVTRGTTLMKMAEGMNIIDGELYCVKAGGELASDETIGRLPFGADCRYTSGNKSLDDNVKALLAACTNSSMTREEMLRAAYLYLRDSGKFGYVGGPHYGRGTSDWAEKEAVTFFTPYSSTKSGGNCYSWAAAFMYIARQLGYDAYVVSGGVPSGNSDHAWVMIPWDDGNEYLFDIELEWGHMHGYYSGQYHYDLYKLRPGNTPFNYYFP